MGYLDDDSRAFGDPEVFGSDAGFADYFTGRSFDNLPQATTCTDWTSTTGMTNVAVNDTTYYPERLSKYPAPCDFIDHMICFADP